MPASEVSASNVEESLFRKIIESAPNAIVVVERSGRIVLVNTQTESLFGYARAELVGRGIELLLPARYRTAHPQDRDNFFADPRSRPMGAGRDLFGLHKDGHEIAVEIGLNPM